MNETTIRRTLIDNALRRVSGVVPDELFRVGARYSGSTMAKHKWVKKIYEGFVFSQGRQQAWPLEATIAAAFVRFAGLCAGYAFSSLEDVIVPSMKRIHEEVSNNRVHEEVAQCLSTALRDVRRS